MDFRGSEMDFLKYVADSGNLGLMSGVLGLISGILERISGDLLWHFADKRSISGRRCWGCAESGCFTGRW